MMRKERSMRERLKELEARIGYEFRDVSLLERALRHSSFTNEKRMPKQECNERLEFLGDAVLELVSSEFLFKEYPKVSEGELTKTRASMVCEPSLAFCARDIDLGKYLLLGKGEEATGGRQRDSVTSDAMEALIGAIYLDSGFTNAKEFIHKFILNRILKIRSSFSIARLFCRRSCRQRDKEAVNYRLTGEDGPDHNKVFSVNAEIGGVSYGSGKGRSKKAAEQEAAYRAILRLKKEQ